MRKAFIVSEVLVREHSIGGGKRNDRDETREGKDKQTTSPTLEYSSGRLTDQEMKELGMMDVSFIGNIGTTIGLLQSLGRQRAGHGNSVNCSAAYVAARSLHPLLHK